MSTIRTTGFLLALLCTKAGFTQDSIVTMADYKKWPAGLSSKVYNVASQGSIKIIIKDLLPADTAALLKQSTVGGTYNKAVQKDLPLSGMEKAGKWVKYDPAGDSLIISFGDQYPSMKTGDSITVTLIKDPKLNAIKISQVGGAVDTKTPADGGTGTDTSPIGGAVKPLALDPECLVNYYTDHFGPTKDFYRTDVGYKEPGDKYAVHIFLDQTGNFLFGSKPTGIQRKYHYLLHVLTNKADSNMFRYAFQTNGDLNDNYSVYGANNINPAAVKGEGADLTNGKQPAPVDCSNLRDEVFNVFPTSDDLTFTLYFIPIKNKTLGAPVKIVAYTLKKTAYYIASFDGGAFNTWLGNPTYTLVNIPSATTSTDQTVKVADNGSSVNFVLMATFYFSPYNILFPYKNCDKKLQRFSPWGRSFLDDDGCLFRKIYPAIGVGLNGTVLNNFYAGLNFEPMQGFGLFVGQNIRKVSSFDMPGFVPGTTVVTQSQFNYYENSKYKNGWAFGAIIDLTVFTKLFGKISVPTTPSP